MRTYMIATRKFKVDWLSARDMLGMRCAGNNDIRAQAVGHASYMYGQTMLSVSV